MFLIFRHIIRLENLNAVDELLDLSNLLLSQNLFGNRFFLLIGRLLSHDAAGIGGIHREIVDVFDDQP